MMGYANAGTSAPHETVRSLFLRKKWNISKGIKKLQKTNFPYNNA